MARKRRSGARRGKQEALDKRRRLMKITCVLCAVALAAAALGCRKDSASTASPPVGAVTYSQDISWGSPVKGLQAGLSAKRTTFEGGKAIDFIVHMQNIDNADLGLEGVNYWRITFDPEPDDWERHSGGLAVALTLKRGATIRGLIRFTNEMTEALFQKHGDDLCFERHLDLPRLRPGKYTVTATNDNLRRGDARAWHGKLSTGPVEIEIVEPYKGAPLPARPPPR
jgi:hypothetical protein